MKGSLIGVQLGGVFGGKNSSEWFFLWGYKSVVILIFGNEQKVGIKADSSYIEECLELYFASRHRTLQDVISIRISSAVREYCRRGGGKYCE